MATNTTYTDAEVLDIAKHQKAIILLIPLSMAAYVAATFVPFLPVFVGIISLVFIYQLAAALKETSPWLFVLLGIIPCISLIALLMINSRATSALKSRGIRVGLLGANEDDLKKIRSIGG